MKRRLIGDQWSNAWDDDWYSPETMDVETDDRSDTHFAVLGPDGNPIPKPVMRVGFWPGGRK